MLVVCATIGGILKTLQLWRVYQMHTLAANNHTSQEDLNKQFDRVIADFKEEQENSGILQRFTNEVEDRRAVLMGNKRTLEFILATNIAIAVLIVIQGLYMVWTTGPTLRTVNTILGSSVRTAAMTLQSAGLKAQNPKLVHKKTKTFYAMALATMILLFIGTSLRVLITSASMEREAKIVASWQALNGEGPAAKSSHSSSFKGVRVNNDALAWNYVRVIKARGSADEDVGFEALGSAGDAIQGDISSEGQHPILWSIIYFVLFMLLTKKNMNSFFSFSKNQGRLVVYLD